MKNKKTILHNNNIWIATGYFVSLFSYTTFPAIQVIFPYRLFTGGTSIIYTFLILFLNFSSIALMISVLHNSKRDFFLKNLLIVLIFVSLFSYFSTSIGKENYSTLIIRWLRDTGKYIFLSIHFLCFPFVLSNSYNLFKKYQRVALFLNALTLPFLYVFFGRFDGRFLYVGTQMQSLLAISDSDYNNYLSLGDPLLFNSLLLLVASPNIFSYLLCLVASVLLLLIGSRVSFLFAIMAILIATPFVFQNVFLNFLTSFRNYLYRRKSFVKLSISKLFVLLALFYILLNVIFDDINFVELLLPENISSQVSGLININNIESSRVWFTLVENDSQDDTSLNQRLELFSCHFDALYSYSGSPLDTTRRILFGNHWTESGCFNYLHSFLSILFDNGLLVFFAVFYMIYNRIKLLISLLKNDLVNSSHMLYIIFVVTFLLIGLTSRVNLSFFLPALMFPYLHLTLHKSSFKVDLFNQRTTYLK